MASLYFSEQHPLIEEGPFKCCKDFWAKQLVMSTIHNLINLPLIIILTSSGISSRTFVTGFVVVLTRKSKATTSSFPLSFYKANQFSV